MTTIRRTTVALVLAGVTALGLAACGGDDTASEPSSSMPASALAEPSDGTSAVGTDPSTWAPIMVKKKTKAVEMVTRQVAVWPALEYAENPSLTAVSSDPTVVEVLPADDGTVVGFRALGPGEAVVKVYEDTAMEGKAFRKVRVTVTE